MAVRHEFGGEKQSSESNERSDPRNPLNPKISKPENIDTLVSRFLDELSGLSSEMTQDENRAAGLPPEAAGSESKVPPQSGPADDGHPPLDSALEKIDEEIEKSLAELESLRTEFATPEDNLAPNAQAKPEAADFSLKEKCVEPATTSPLADSEEQAWKRLQLFRNRVSQRNWFQRLSIRWVLAGAVLIAILAIGAFYFLSSDNDSPEGATKTQVVESSQPLQLSGDIQKQVVPAVSPKETDLATNNGTAPLKPLVQGTGRNRQASGSTRSAEMGSTRTQASTAGQDLRRSAQNTSAVPIERPKANEESSRPALEQAAASTTPASEQPSPAINSPAVSSQPKPEPVVPSGTTNNAGGTSTAAAVAASVPEVPPTTAPAAVADAGSAAVQTKTRVARMAEVLTRVQPVYPAIARTQRIGGKVEVEAEINEKGDVVRTRVLSGPNILRLAAEQALLKWKFKPASVDGVSVPSKARITVSFSVQ